MPAEARFTVVVQDVVVGPVLAEQVAPIASRPLYLVVLAPSLAMVARRKAARPKTGYDDGWSIEEFDAGFRATTPRIGLWIDSSVQTPEETVEEIFRRARSEAAVLRANVASAHQTDTTVAAGPLSGAAESLGLCDPAVSPGDCEGGCPLAVECR